MIVERFARDSAANTFFSIRSREGRTTADIVGRSRIGEDQRSPIGQTQRIEDREWRRKLNVFRILLEGRNSWRADLRERGELALGHVQAFPALDCFFDKNRPIEEKLPFHLRSMRLRRLSPSPLASTFSAAACTAFSAALRRWSSFSIVSESALESRPQASPSATMCLGLRRSSARFCVLSIDSASVLYSGWSAAATRS